MVSHWLAVERILSIFIVKWRRRVESGLITGSNREPAHPPYLQLGRPQGFFVKFTITAIAVIWLIWNNAIKLIHLQDCPLYLLCTKVHDEQVKMGAKMLLNHDDFQSSVVSKFARAFELLASTCVLLRLDPCLVEGKAPHEDFQPQKEDNILNFGKMTDRMLSTLQI